MPTKPKPAQGNITWLPLVAELIRLIIDLLSPKPKRPKPTKPSTTQPPK